MPLIQLYQLKNAKDKLCRFVESKAWAKFNLPLSSHSINLSIFLAVLETRQHLPGMQLGFNATTHHFRSGRITAHHLRKSLDR